METKPQKDKIHFINTVMVFCVYALNYAILRTLNPNSALKNAESNKSNHSVFQASY